MSGGDRRPPSAPGFGKPRRAVSISGAATLFDVALVNMPHGLCMFDSEKNLILCNPAYAHLYVLPEALTRAGTSLEDILAFRNEQGSGPADISTYFVAVDEAHRTGGHAKRRILLQDGRIIQVTHNPMIGGGYVATHEDVTAWAQAEAEALHLATHDVLTGLSNRNLFAAKLTEALQCAQEGHLVALHCFDLDRFKVVNDTYGHLVGDQLLRGVADRVLKLAGPSDLIARIGGDEFVFLQTNLGSREEAQHMSSRIIAEVGFPFAFDSRVLSVGASVGTAVCHDDSLSTDAFLQQADMALYRAKLDGRNRAHLYETGMGSHLRDRRRLEADLRHAVVAEELDLRYQPVVVAKTARVCGFEALLRWKHPSLGWISPSEFISIAEETGLIVEIDRWVLGRACHDAASWPDDIKVAVNLSPLEFGNAGIVDTVRSTLAASGLASSRLELEITESVLLVDGESTLSSLHELRRMGVRIALDDFGTGYASLSYLRRFPFDKIKIDRSFIRDMEEADCAAIVQAVTTLGLALRMIVTAEGVETQHQVDLLRAQGCDEIQGFLFSPAVAVEAVLDMLRLRDLPTAIAA